MRARTNRRRFSRSHESRGPIPFARAGTRCFATIVGSFTSTPKYSPICDFARLWGGQRRWTQERIFPIGKVISLPGQDASNITVREILSTSLIKSGTIFPIGNIM